MQIVINATITITLIITHFEITEVTVIIFHLQCLKFIAKHKGSKKEGIFVRLPYTWARWNTLHRAFLENTGEKLS